MAETVSNSDLLQQIKHAFEGVPQPKSRTLFVSEAMDAYTTPKQADFLGQWEDIPDAHLEACPHALAYLDAEGMRFYLPAYLCWCIQLPNTRRPLAFDHTLYTLDPHLGQPEMHRYFLNRFQA